MKAASTELCAPRMKCLKQNKIKKPLGFVICTPKIQEILEVHILCALAVFYIFCYCAADVIGG